MTTNTRNIKTKVFLDDAAKLEIAKLIVSDPELDIHGIAKAYDVSHGTVRTVMRNYGVLIHQNKMVGLAEDSPMRRQTDPAPASPSPAKVNPVRERDNSLLQLGRRVAELDAQAAKLGYKVELSLL